jgi:hypothetical protein
MKPHLTQKQKHEQFDTFSALYCPTEFKGLCRDISDALTVTTMQVFWLTEDLARVRADLRSAMGHLSPKPEETLPVIAAGQQQRGIAGEREEG